MGIDKDAASAPPSQRGGIWHDLPPKRRRLYVWLIWLFVLGLLVKIPLQLLGMPAIWASTAVLGLSVVILIPLAMAGWKEFQQRRADGQEPQPSVTGGGVIAWAVTAIAFWAVSALLVAFQGPFIPLMPLIVTAFAVLRLRQRHQQRTASNS